MPTSSFIDFKAVKAALTMEQVLQHYHLLDKFKRSGDSLSGACPIHKGSNATQFRVSLSKNLWNCFSECNRGGNALDFIAQMEDVSIHAAALKAIEWFGIDAEPPDSDVPKTRPTQPKKKNVNPQSQTENKTSAQEQPTQNKPLGFRLDKLERDHPYLRQRGLTAETVQDFGLGYCTKGVMAGHIAIPINNLEGKVVAYAGRWPGEPAEDIPKYKLPQGFRKSLEVFNIDRASHEPTEQPLVIVEGFFDCIKLHQHGCRKVVALMGSTLSAAQEELIRQHTDRSTRVIVMLDEDDAGRAGRDDIALRLSRFCFVTSHQFEAENTQPEDLSGEEVREIIGGVA